MIWQTRPIVRKWKLLSDTRARELGEAFIEQSEVALALYGEIRRRNSLDDGPGYPSSSLGGGSSGGISDRTGEIAADLADNGNRDPVHLALVRLEITLDECEKSLRYAISQALALPAIRPPERKTRDICVTCGTPAWICGELRSSKCGECLRREQHLNRMVGQRVRRKR